MIFSFDGSVSEEDIYDEGVSDYDIYSYYLGYQPELGTAYKSILREGDDTPSFSIFCSEYHPKFDYMWKDSGSGKLSGHVWDFVNALFQFNSLFKTRLKVALDFGLVDESLGDKFNIPKGKEGAVKGLEKPTDNIRHRIYYKEAMWTGRHNDFFVKDLGVKKKLLPLYRVSAFKMYWVDDYKTQPIEVHRDELGFVYHIKDRVKLYRPLVAKVHGEEFKKYKFRTDYLSNYVEGWEQIDWSNNDLLVITKSTKDVMWFKSHFGVEAVSPKSENTPISIQYIDYLKSHFKKIVYFFDNDQAGFDSAQKEIARTHLEALYLPVGLPKDPTDFYMINPSEALSYVGNLLSKQLYHVPILIS